jgi:hypothetical protein
VDNHKPPPQFLSPERLTPADRRPDPSRRRKSDFQCHRRIVRQNVVDQRALWDATSEWSSSAFPSSHVVKALRNVVRRIIRELAPQALLLERNERNERNVNNLGSNVEWLKLAERGPTQTSHDR